MVEIEASEKILVRLAITAMLGDDDSGHGFEHFAGTADGAFFQFLPPDRALGRSIGDAEHAVASFLHHYLGQLGRPLLGLAYGWRGGRHCRRSVSLGRCQTWQGRTKTPDKRQECDPCPEYAFSLSAIEIHCFNPASGFQKKKPRTSFPPSDGVKAFVALQFIRRSEKISRILCS